MFIERAGELELLVTEDDRPERQVFCFRTDEPHRPAIYLQARPQSDGPWSRNTIGFRYEVLGNKSAASNVGRGGLQSEYDSQTEFSPKYMHWPFINNFV